MPQFEQESKENLHTSMKDLVSDGEEILVSDEALSRALTLRIQLI